MNPNWPANQVEMWPLSKLIPYARNARTHTPEQVRQIAASMREWGWTIPVLADEGGMLLAGHARVQAAELNTYTEAPVIVARGWSEAKKRAYVLADNKLAMNAGWNEDLLGVELLELRDLGFELPLTGFDGAELESLMREVAEAGYPDLPEGDRAPYQQVTFTLHDDQVKLVAAAVKAAKAQGEFVDALNDNANGNALARICEQYLANLGLEDFGPDDGAGQPGRKEA
jgi:ParB-like chromosome segregation protein Spo0J